MTVTMERERTTAPPSSHERISQLPWFSLLCPDNAGQEGAMSGEVLARRAQMLELLAKRAQGEADKAHGPRAAALREESEELRAEALCFALAAGGRQR